MGKGSPTSRALDLMIYHRCSLDDVIPDLIGQRHVLLYQSVLNHGVLQGKKINSYSTRNTHTRAGTWEVGAWHSTWTVWHEAILRW